MIGWMKNSAFSVQEVQSDGSLTALDLVAARLAMHADEIDMKANRSGAIGITSRIAERRVQEQSAAGTSKLREAAFERATIQILDRLQAIPLLVFFVGLLTWTSWPPAYQTALGEPRMLCIDARSRREEVRS
jgi:hypothetical protein